MVFVCECKGRQKIRISKFFYVFSCEIFTNSPADSTQSAFAAPKAPQSTRLPYDRTHHPTRAALPAPFEAIRSTRSQPVPPPGAQPGNRLTEPVVAEMPSVRSAGRSDRVERMRRSERTNGPIGRNNRAERANETNVTNETDATNATNATNATKNLLRQ